MNEKSKKIVVVKHNDDYKVNFVEKNENEFIKDFIYSKLVEKGEEAYIEDQNLYFDECENYINFGYFVNCGDLCIAIYDMNLLPEVSSVVDKYNKERENIKIKKLK